MSSPSGRSQRALDWLNFFVADVETAFGPFVALYLAQEGWQQGRIGTAIAINSAAAMGVLGQYGSIRAPFLAAAGLTLPAGLALLLIRGNEIDYARRHIAKIWSGWFRKISRHRAAVDSRRPTDWRARCIAN